MFLMMMMIAPNSFVRQKERAQGKDEEEAEGRRNGGPTGTPTPGADDPTDPTQSGVSDAWNRRNRERWCGIPLDSRGSGF